MIVASRDQEAQHRCIVLRSSIRNSLLLRFYHMLLGFVICIFSGCTYLHFVCKMSDQRIHTYIYIHTHTLFLSCTLYMCVCASVRPTHMYISVVCARARARIAWAGIFCDCESVFVSVCCEHALDTRHAQSCTDGIAVLHALVIYLMRSG